MIGPVVLLPLASAAALVAAALTAWAPDLMHGPWRTVLLWLIPAALGVAHFALLRGWLHAAMLRRRWPICAYLGPVLTAVRQPWSRTANLHFRSDRVAAGRALHPGERTQLLTDMARGLLALRGCPGHLVVGLRTNVQLSALARYGFTARPSRIRGWCHRQLWKVLHPRGAGPGSAASWSRRWTARIDAIDFAYLERMARVGARRTARIPCE